MAARKRKRRRARRRAPRLVWLAAGLVTVAALFVALRPRSLPPPPLTPPRFVAPRPLPPPPPIRGEEKGARPAGRSGRAEADRRFGPGGDAPARARISIVVDDLGDDLETARAVVALEPAVTIAVLPFRAASRAVATHAVERGREVILHLPLEPERGEAMAGGDGFLRTTMAPGRLEERLEASLRAVPYIVGVNGHMGSRFTQDPAAMDVLLGALHARGLFFLDSRTSTKSIARVTARRVGVSFAERSLFLDHDPAPAAIDAALLRLANVARVEGAAIAIAHPYRSTLAALSHWLAATRAAGLDVVPVSMLVR